MVETSVGQRFSQLIQQLGMSKNAFAMSLDKTATVIQHLVDERNKPGFDLMRKVFEVYPNVSKDWLLMGEGPMLLNGASISTLADVAPVAMPAVAPMKPLDASATPGFPAPLFAVSTARPPAPVAPNPLPTEAEPPAVPSATVPEAPPAAIAQPAPDLAPATPQPEVATTPPAAASPAATATPPTAPDAAYLTAALHAQHLQHQLALAEQRNQHLLEQQKLILERQALMQQMLDFMRRPA